MSAGSSGTITLVRSPRLSLTVRSGPWLGDYAKRKLERAALILRERAGATRLSISCHQDRLRLGRERLVVRADLLPQGQARCPDPLEPARDDHPLVLESKLAPEVDGDPREDEVPEIDGASECPLDPL